MNFSVVSGVLLPFLGTSLGAASVFVMKKEMGKNLQRVLTGFAAGVMVAASVWSLLIPSMDYAQGMGKLSFIPAGAYGEQRYLNIAGKTFPIKIPLLQE